MTDQAKLIEDLRTYPWGVDDTPEGPRLLKRAADLLASKDGELERLSTALTKINTIRNSIVGCQRVNFSEHVYPLVAALDEAGFEGDEYEVSRANVGTLIERAVQAEFLLAVMAACAEQEIARLKDVASGHFDISRHHNRRAHEAESLTLSLRAENERLRGALRTISNGTEDRAPPFRAIGPSQMAGIARAALSQSTGDTK